MSLDSEVARLHTKDIYKQLADHLFSLGMGYPPSEDLEEILRANLNQKEAEVALALPTQIIPLQPTGIDDIVDAVSLSKAELASCGSD